MFFRRVLVELIPVCQSTVHGSSHPLAPLIRVATELLYGDTLGVTETSMVTAGIVGRFVKIHSHPSGAVLTIFKSHTG